MEHFQKTNAAVCKSRCGEEFDAAWLRSRRHAGDGACICSSACGAAQRPDLSEPKHHARRRFRCRRVCRQHRPVGRTEARRPARPDRCRRESRRAGGNVAAKTVAGSAADGHTILVTTTALAINETMHKNKGFAADDLATVAIVGSSPESLSAPPATQAGNISEFVKSSQGKPINFGTAGAGSGSHIAAEYFFKVLAKVPATHVPFQGGAPVTNAAVAGHIDLLAATFAANIVAQLRAGKLKGLAIASEKRNAAMPDVPTFVEAGFPGFTAASWVGFFVPAKTPPDVIAKLHDAIDAMVRD